MTHRLQLEMDIRADWAGIDLIRAAVRLCVGATTFGSELKDSISMVTAELMENAVKYGLNDGTVTFTLNANEDAIVVTVTNAIADGSEHVEALLERISWLSQFPTAEEAYLAALDEVYKSPNRARSSSRLGIVRIAYEGACAVECDTSSRGRVTVRASHPVRGAA